MYLMHNGLYIKQKRNVNGNLNLPISSSFFISMHGFGCNGVSHRNLGSSFDHESNDDSNSFSFQHSWKSSFLHFFFVLFLSAPLAFATCLQVNCSMEKASHCQTRGIPFHFSGNNHYVTLRFLFLRVSLLLDLDQTLQRLNIIAA